MRLLNVGTLRLEEFSYNAVPPYAILSHTWGRDHEEVSFRDVEDDNLGRFGSRPIKLEGCCKQAKEDGYSYIWIDTCCIDKTNSVELHEAINSMFQWYRGASICYTYLSDVPADDNPKDPKSKFFSSRWFERGWTLQELLAPTKLRFYNSEWHCLGTKGDMCTMVEKITGIPAPFLLGIAELHDASVAQRMAWASRRVTKKPEDIAYCLLGIFGVTMSMIYGEGNKAFRRLQEEVMKDIGDDSILAWGLDRTRPTPNTSADAVPGRIWATAPSDFANCGQIVSRDRPTGNSFDMYGGSLRVHLSLTTTSAGETFGLLNCGPEHDKKQVVGIPLSITSGELGDEYVRPEGRCSILLSDVASDVPAKLIRIRNGQQSREPAATNQLYWFHVQESGKTGLELIDVEPRDCWHKERALIETLLDQEDDDVLVVARFRHKEEGSRDFLVVLQVWAQEPYPQPRCHVMICSRLTSLRHVLEWFGMMRHEDSGNQSSSNGILNLHLTLEPDKTRPMCIVRTAVISDAPAAIIDATMELHLVHWRLELEHIWRYHNTTLLEIEKLRQQREEKLTDMSPMQERLATVEEKLRELHEERRHLIEGLGNGGQEVDLINSQINGNELRHRELSAQESEASNRFLDMLRSDQSDKKPSFEDYCQSQLSWAAENGHEVTVEMLLEKGAEIDARGTDGWTPLRSAAERGHEVIVKLLLEHGAEVDVRDNKGQTPLLCAVSRGHTSVAKLLLEKGAEIDAKDMGGWTPLQWAAQDWHDATIKLLLEYGAEIDKEDKNGQTLLMWAAMRGDEDIISLLLEKGAETWTMDKDGATAADWAARSGHHGIARWIRRRSIRRS